MVLLAFVIITTYNIFISYYSNNVIYENNNVFDGIDEDRLILNTSLVLNYLTNSLKQDLSHIQHLEVIDSSLFLELDKECIKNLELVETMRTKDRQNSLLGFMDKTKTAMGSRLLKSYIISPSIDKYEILRRQNLVEKLINEFLFKSELKTLLYEIYDLERLTGKVACSNLNARDVLQLKSSIAVLPDINLILKSLNLKELETFRDLYELLDNSIKEEVPLSIKEGGIIKDGFNSEVDELRNIKNNGKEFISNFERDERERTGIKGLKIGYNKVFGYYIEVPKGQVGLVREEFQYDRKQTISNCERYITPLLKEKENLILNAEEKLNNLEYEIFCNIKDEIKKHISKLQQVSSQIAFYDVMQSFATVAEEKNFIKPTINDEGIVNIISGRHPVVESVIDGEYIDNDIILDKLTNILIITGPNMSGKSTYMRELALIAIMNQIGCYVPASSAKIPLFDAIYTRIGAADDIVSGQSTFMVEMNEVNNALEFATKNSLILFDEIDVIALDRINSNDVREMGRVTSTILRELDRLTDLNKEIVIIATTNLFSNFDKALIRRFDAVINFNRYTKEDLIEVAEYYFSSFVRNFKGISKDTRLFKKILSCCENLPYPGELKNIIKTSLAFSDTQFEHDYLRRLYNNLIGNLDGTEINQLYANGFTIREIEKLKGESKSNVARKLNKEDEENE